MHKYIHACMHSYIQTQRHTYLYVHTHIGLQNIHTYIHLRPSVRTFEKTWNSLLTSISLHFPQKRALGLQPVGLNHSNRLLLNTQFNEIGITANKPVVVTCNRRCCSSGTWWGWTVWRRKWCWRVERGRRGGDGRGKGSWRGYWR